MFICDNSAVLISRSKIVFNLADFKAKSTSSSLLRASRLESRFDIRIDQSLQPALIRRNISFNASQLLCSGNYRGCDLDSLSLDRLTELRFEN